MQHRQCRERQQQAPQRAQRQSRRRPLRLAAALLAIAVALAAWLTLDSPSQAQSMLVLVSNFDQTQDAGAALNEGTSGQSDAARAQEFTTGAKADGYSLASIALRLRIASGQSLPDVTLRSGSATGAVVATLTSTATTSGSIQDIAFAPASAVTLVASTRYWVVAEGGGGVIYRTGADEEDTDSAAGWSIANSGEVRLVGSTSFSQSGESLKIQVNGTQVDPVLVSNVGQTAGTDQATGSDRVSFGQLFTTGSHVDGYLLSSVELGLKAASGVGVEVSLWLSSFNPIRGQHFSSWIYSPSKHLATLSGPASIDNDASTLETFGAVDVLLLPDTTYWIVVTRTAGADDGLSVGVTSSESAIDTGGSDGFSLGDNIWTRAVPTAGQTEAQGWSDYTSTSDVSMKLRLRGSEATRSPGPYLTNRNRQGKATTAATSATVSRYATSFSTGTLPSSPVVTSVLLSVAADSGVTPRVAIHSNSSGSPSASPITNGTLTAPTEISTALNAPDRAEFTADNPITLSASTTYWVVIDVGSGSGNLSVGTTDEAGSDDTLSGVAMWSFGGAMRAYDGSSWSDDSAGRRMRMAIHGTVDPLPGSLFAATLDVGLPQVGLPVEARISDLARRLASVSWQWQRGETKNGTFTDIPVADGGTQRAYTPDADDLGKWLKVTATYDNAFVSMKSVSGVSPNPVLSRPILSNAGVPGGATYSLNGTGIVTIAQKFTTGTDPTGYVLYGLRLPIAANTTDHALSWTLHADSSGEPAASPLFAALAVPAADVDVDPKTFTQLSHPGIHLKANSTYWAVVTLTQVVDGTFPNLNLSGISEWGEQVRLEGPTAELDMGSKPGWTLPYSALTRNDVMATGWQPWSQGLEITTKIVPRMSVLASTAVTPEYESATVNGTTLVITFNEDLGDAANLANSAFTVKKTPAGSSETTLTQGSTAPAISGKTVTLTLDSASSVTATDTLVKVSYAKPTSGMNNKLVDKFGNEVASFTDEEVVNELADDDPPGLSTSIQPAVFPSGDALLLTYDEALDTGSTPDKSAFEVMATPSGGSAASFTPTDVGVNGSTVLLSFAKPFANNDALTLTYTKPSSNPIQDVAGNDAPSITTPLVVTNNSTIPRVSIAWVHTDASPIIAHAEFRVTRSNTSTSALAVNVEFTQDDTYLDSTTSTITIPAGQTSAVRVFPSTYSGNTSGDLTAKVAEDDAHLPALSPNHEATVRMKVPNTGAVLTISHSQLAWSVTEGDALDATVHFTTGAGVAQPREDVQVIPLTLAGSADSGDDFTALNGQMRLTATAADWTVQGAGYRATKTFRIQTTEDAVAEPPERFDIPLFRAGDGPEPTCPCRASVTINDDDPLALQTVAVTSTPPNTSTTNDAYYDKDDAISFTLTFNGEAAVTGAPQFSFRLGTRTRQAEYATRSGPGRLAFTYTVAEDDDDHDGISWPAGTVNLNGGTIKLAPDHDDAILSYDAQTTLSAQKVDWSKPTLKSQTLFGNILTLNYSEALNTTAPANSAFTVTVNGSPNTVTDVNISGSTAKLTLTTEVTDEAATVTVTYAKPSSNPIRDRIGREADAFSNQPVTVETNQRPTSADATAPVIEDTDYTIRRALFSYMDPENDAFSAIVVATLPSEGSLRVGVNAATAGQQVTVAQLNAGELVYRPPSNLNGDAVDSFTFRVVDAQNRQSTVAYTMTINIAARPDPAEGMPTVSGVARVGRTLTASISDISDPDGLPLPSAFRYQWKRYAANGTTFRANIGSNSRTYTPVEADEGHKIRVEVRFTDRAGGSEGPLLSDPYPRVGTVVEAQAAPLAADGRVRTRENTDYTFQTADFNYSEANAEPLVRLIVVSIPADGSLTLSGSAVAASGTVTAAQLASGLLVYSPPSNEGGRELGDFTFRVHDGENQSVAAYTMHVDVVETLVSNLGQTTCPRPTGENPDTGCDPSYAEDRHYSQEFLSGLNPHGYELTSVDLIVDLSRFDPAPTVTLRRGKLDGPVVATLSSPMQRGETNTQTNSREVEFQLSETVYLAANSEYVVRFDRASSQNWREADSTDEDANSALGWSIADKGRRQSTALYDSLKPYQMRLNGFSNTSTPAGVDLTRPHLSRWTVSGVTLTLTYSEPLDASSLPAARDFRLTNWPFDDNQITVSRVRISGPTLTLTLSRAFLESENVWLEYRPGPSPLQDRAGNWVPKLEQFELQDPMSVGRGDEQRPADIAEVDATVDGSQLEISYGVNLDDEAGKGPAVRDFAVTVDGKVVTVSSVGISEQTVQLRLARAVTEGQTVTLSYTPGDNPVKSTDNAHARPIVLLTVRNLVDTTAPKLLENGIVATTTQIQLKYSEALDEDSVPAPAHFFITRGDPPVRAEVSTVDVTDRTVTLTFTETRQVGEMLTILYPLGQALIQDPKGNRAPSILKTVTVVRREGPNQSPAFDSASATLDVNENAVSGSLGRITATDPESDPLTYSIAETRDHEAFDDDFAFNTSTGEFSVKSGATIDFETRSSYRVTLQVTDGLDNTSQPSDAIDDTIEVTIQVTDIDEPGALTLSSQSPEVGTPLVASLTEADGGVSVQTWRWSSSATRTGTFAPISGASASRYTPVAGDTGRYLRVTATYTDAHGSGKSLNATTTDAVLGAPVNRQPTFARDSYAWSVAPDAAADSVVGTASATDPEGDPLTYGVTGQDLAAFAAGADFALDAASGQITVRESASLTDGRTYRVNITVRDNKDRDGNADSAVDASAPVEITVRSTTPPGPVVGGGGGGGGAPPVVTPSDEDLDWNVTRDIESLDDAHDEPTGLWSDGETMFALNNAASDADAVFAYALDDGERQPDRDFELDRRNRFAHGIWSDGETVWVADSGQDRLFAYALDSGDRAESREFELAEANRDPRGIWSDGETVYVLDSVRDALFGYDLVSGALAFEHALDSLNGSPRGIWSDGTSIWVSDDGANRVFAYRLEDDGLRRIEAEEFSFRSLLKAGNSDPRGIWSDGDTLWVADSEDDRIYSYNMPDAIQAYLRSLELSGLEIGEFASGRREYSAAVPPELSETTVAAVATQDTATMTVNPEDADEETDGHQVALADLTEIVVTVMSADRSRERSYRVALEAGMVNRAPIGSELQPLELSVDGEPATLTLADLFSDPDDDPLRYTVGEPQPAGVVTVSRSGGLLRLQPRTTGEATMSLTASDGESTSQPLIVRITVEASDAVSELRVAVRSLPDGRVEFGLQTRASTGSWSERLLPRARFLLADVELDRWLVSTAMSIDLADREAQVRVVARRLTDGRAEFGLQLQSSDGDWGERLLPRARFLLVDAELDRWLVSSPIDVGVDSEG